MTRNTALKQARAEIVSNGMEILDKSGAIVYTRSFNPGNRRIQLARVRVQRADELMGVMNVK